MGCSPCGPRLSYWESTSGMPCTPRWFRHVPEGSCSGHCRSPPRFHIRRAWSHGKTRSAGHERSNNDIARRPPRACRDSSRRSYPSQCAPWCRSKISTFKESGRHCSSPFRCGSSDNSVHPAIPREACATLLTGRWQLWHSIALAPRAGRFRWYRPGINLALPCNVFGTPQVGVVSATAFLSAMSKLAVEAAQRLDYPKRTIDSM
jgi:hypothetical protein